MTYHVNLIHIKCFNRLAEIEEQHRNFKDRRGAGRNHEKVNLHDLISKCLKKMVTFMLSHEAKPDCIVLPASDANTSAESIYSIGSESSSAEACKCG